MAVTPPPASFRSKANPVFAQSIMAGLRAPQKYIESKWLYDAHGSLLFDAITELEEYYPTRTELGILRRHAVDLQRYVGSHTALFELGSGSSVKTRILLDALPGLHSYVPIDISKDHLQAAVRRVAQEYSALKVLPVVADFTADVPLPAVLDDAAKILFFPGSTIGNFETEDAASLLGRMRRVSGVVAFVIGFDLVKTAKTLIRAYDDTSGVTAEFNLNLLTRINRELGADFDLNRFEHQARWNSDKNRIEMHLVSRQLQTVEILGQTIAFVRGESIHSENSHKYTPGQLEEIARQQGWYTDQIWMDAEQLFGVAVLTPDHG
ncbi:MAG: L-histidine N(alpha)-methyltransferase [Rhodobacteraceae bacterium]|nr:L-histidine N(alpha)-methyltransferase [Paracoccaceae bacterium]